MEVSAISSSSVGILQERSGNIRQHCRRPTFSSRRAQLQRARLSSRQRVSAPAALGHPAMRSAEAANENQRRGEGVFDELTAAKPGNVSYIVLRLANGSFVTVWVHN